MPTFPGQFTPALRAGEDINPYRFVEIGTDNQGLLAGAAAVDVVGVCEGDNKAFDSVLHAQSGDPIRLQPGDVKLVELGATLSAGARVTSDANGLAVAAISPNPYYGILIQGGVNGTIAQMFWMTGIVGT